MRRSKADGQDLRKDRGTSGTALETPAPIPADVFWAQIDDQAAGSRETSSHPYADARHAGLVVAFRLAQGAPLAQAFPTASLRTQRSSPRLAEPSTGSRPRGARAWNRILRSRWLLLAILVVQAALSLRLIWSNTAFADESLYLWSGHLEITHLLYGSPIPQFQTYFSGAPVIYPVLAAIADSYGGLALARALSLVFMLGATCLLYGTTRHLLDRGAALSAAGLFAVLGPVQVLGAFATYDAMAIFLLALGSWLVVRARGRLSELLLFAGGIALALAVATKYATALWVPVVIVLAALTTARGGWFRAVLRSVRLTAYTAVPVALALVRFGGAFYIHGVMFTTLDRQADSTFATAATVLGDSFAWIGLLLALAVIGTIVSFTVPGRTKWLCLTLTAAMLLAPLHQAQIQTSTSLHKHVVFGAWFGAIVAGYAVAKTREVNVARAWRAGAVTIAITAFLGFPQATQMFIDGWPNTAAMNAELARIVPDYGCPCMIAEESQLRYYLPRLSSYNIVGPYTFYYWDNASQKELHGLTAYEIAIEKHYFAVIEIDPAENLAYYKPVVRILQHTAGYSRVDVIRIDNWGRQTMQIWRYTGGGSQ